MMSNRMITAGLAAALALGACSSDPKAPWSARQDPVAGANYPRIVVEQPLQRWFVAGEPKVEKDAAGLLHVTVPARLQSEPGGFSRVQYRFIFLRGGVPLTAQSEWVYQAMEPRNQVFLRGNSMDAAEDWRLEVRVAR